MYISFTVMQAASAAKMALLKNLQHKEGLPDPKGSLSSEVQTAAIARVSLEVQAGPVSLSHLSTSLSTTSQMSGYM